MSDLLKYMLFRNEVFMAERILDWWNALSQEKRKMIIGIGLALLFVILVAVSVFSIAYDLTKDKGNGESEFVNSQVSEEVENTEMTELESVTETEVVTEMAETEEISSETESEVTESEERESEEKSESQVENTKQEDPQDMIGGGMSNQSGASVDISQVVDQLPTNETQEVTLGIDVSKFQGNIDWKKVAESGVDFAIIRVGYRTPDDGVIGEDPKAKYNLQEATKHGIKIGAYFFSTAISQDEAIEEAKWVADYIAKYQITYPVAYDCEAFDKSKNRHSFLTKTQRTDNAIAFLNQIAEEGYSPMFYASKSGMENSTSWEMSRLEGAYKIWVAQYPSTPYPQTEKSSYSGSYDMWQYTNKGNVPGIAGSVDLNVANFGFRNTEGPQDTEAPEEVVVDVEEGLDFSDVSETKVTGNPETWLRSAPDRSDDNNKVHLLKTGEIAIMTGISGDGKWARVKYGDDQILYAWKGNLKEPTYEELHGIKTQFTPVDEVKVTARYEEVNLRNIPSTTNSNSEVIVVLKKGQEAILIGENKEVGWSKVSYNGQILYCVTSKIETVENSAEETTDSTENIAEETPEA